MRRFLGVVLAVLFYIWVACLALRILGICLEAARAYVYQLPQQ